MAVEQDELKLTVTLDDQASEQLGNLHKALNGIVMAVVPAQKGLQQVGQALHGLGGHAKGLHGSLGGLAARGGFIGGFFYEVGRQVENMVKQFAEAVLDIEAYADSMVKLDQVSTRASTSMGQFRANVAVFRESGVSGEQAGKMLSGYSDALADLQRPNSRILVDVMRGQVGAPRENMLELVRTVMTSDQQTGINAIRAAGQAIRAEHESAGRPELGAAAQANFYARWGMPGLENVRGELKAISAEESRMYADRRRDAERYQTSVAKTNEAWDKGIKSVQAIAFETLPIASGSEKVAEFFGYMVAGAQALERALRNTNTEADKQRSEEARKKVVTPEGKEITAQEGMSEDAKRKEGLQRRFNPRRSETTRPGETLPPPDEATPGGGTYKNIPLSPGGLPGERGQYGSDIEFDPFANVKARKRVIDPAAAGQPYRRAGLLGSEVAAGGGFTLASEVPRGPGGEIDVTALGIPSIGDLLKPDPANAIVLPFNPDDYAGTGWRGLPKSKNVIDLTGDKTGGQTAQIEEQTERMGLLSNEVGRLNEFLAPELLRMLLGQGSSFHNAPQGGVEGESNPMQIPPGAAQPGGGAAAEARTPASSSSVVRKPEPLLRPWQQGDPTDRTYTTSKGVQKNFPVLSSAATPLPTATYRDGQPYLSNVSEGKGVATWFGQGKGGWGDLEDKPGSNALRVPEALQGISLSNESTVGQFFYVTDPNTGLTHVRQQTDIGPGVRTQKLVDISVAAAQREGYTKQSFEAMQERVKRGELQPWEVKSTGFGTQGTSTKPAPEGKIPTVETQNITRVDQPGQPYDPRAGGGSTLPSGMDVEFNPFQASGGPAQSTLDLPSGGSGGDAIDTKRGAIDTGPEEGAGKGKRLDSGGGSFGGGGAATEWSSSNRGGGFNERFGDWSGGSSEADWHKQATLASSALGESASGRANPVASDEQIWNATLAANPYARPLVTAAGFVHGLSRTEGEDPVRGPADVMDRATARGDVLDRSAARGDVLDRAAARGVDVNQSGMLSVDVKAPEGTTVRAEGEGVFNKTETSRQVPMQQ